MNLDNGGQRDADGTGTLAGPAARLVFRLARSDASDRLEFDFSAVRDWHHVLRLASDENALIALRRGIGRLQRGTIPIDVERQLAILSLDRELRMRRLQERLEESIEALNAVGIEPLLLKGAALAYTLYGSFCARPMRDVDLLVRPARADQARTIMLDLGWALDSELPGDSSYEAHHHLPPLRDLTGSGLRLEVHRALLPFGNPFRFDEDEIWSASRPVRVGAGQALVMHPSHHAVHIAVHFAWAHMLDLGGWHAFRDLGTLASSGALDWDDFVRTGSRCGASTCCYWTLRLARALAELPVSDRVLRRLRPAVPEFVRRRLTRHFVRGLARSGDACPSARLKRVLWSIAMQPGLSGHGRVRPWRVSLDLMDALEEKDGPSNREWSASLFTQMGRSGRYISEILV
jgi:hypothetical protein